MRRFHAPAGQFYRKAAAGTRVACGEVCRKLVLSALCGKRVIQPIAVHHVLGHKIVLGERIEVIRNASLLAGLEIWIVGVHRNTRLRHDSCHLISLRLPTTCEVLIQEYVASRRPVAGAMRMVAIEVRSKKADLLRHRVFPTLWARAPGRLCCRNAPHPEPGLCAIPVGVALWIVDLSLTVVDKSGCTPLVSLVELAVGREFLVIG